VVWIFKVLFFRLFFIFELYLYKTNIKNWNFIYIWFLFSSIFISGPVSWKSFTYRTHFPLPNKTFSQNGSISTLISIPISVSFD
jgi:hypothetical protein